MLVLVDIVYDINVAPNPYCLKFVLAKINAANITISQGH